MAMNYKQRYAIQKGYEKKILKFYPDINNKSGIYILTRQENGFKFAYIGQSEHILTRMGEHLNIKKSNPQHIDFSLNKHGLYSDENLNGWRIEFFNCESSQMNDFEQEYILKYANDGYQLRNKTSGSQGEGKQQIADYQPRKGYRKGVEQGRQQLAKEIAHLFDLHLNVVKKSEKPNKNQDKALAKFWSLLETKKE